MITVVKYKTGLSIPQEYNEINGCLYWYKLVNQIYINEERNLMIYNYVSTLQDKKILLIVTRSSMISEPLSKLSSDKILLASNKFEPNDDKYNDIDHVVYMIPSSQVKIPPKCNKITMFVDNNPVLVNLCRRSIKFIADDKLITISTVSNNTNIAIKDYPG